MSRILAALCVSVLLSASALAEGQYELAKPLPDCYGRSLQYTNETWVDDPAEIARIRATDDVVSRWRNILRIGSAGGLAATTFVDLKSAPDHCADRDIESYTFQGIFGRYAFVTAKKDDGETFSWILDTINGQRDLSDGTSPSGSPDGRYTVATEGGGTGQLVPLIVHSVERALEVAHLPTLDTAGGRPGLAVIPGTFAWQDATSLRLEIVSIVGEPGRRKADETTRRQAILHITPDSIELQVEKTGEILTAPFKPVSP